MFLRRRFYRLTSGVAVVTIIWLLYSAIRLNNDEKGLPRNEGSGMLINTEGCRIPDISPFDPSIRAAVTPGLFVKCPDVQPLTYIDGGLIKVNKSAFGQFKEEFDSCLAEEIHRKDGNSDDDFYYDNQNWFTDSIPLTSEYTRVVCYGVNGGTLSMDYHAAIFRKFSVEERCERVLKSKPKSPDKERLNIVMLGMDSVSRLNFARHMPKTRDFLLHKLKAVELEGFNKVADNTYVNLIPMFAGKFAKELPYDEKDSDVPFDKFPFIWKNYSAAGYRTLYAEDAPHIAIFNYAKAGFHKSPADYYPRPWNLAMEQETEMWSQGKNCINNKLETKVVLDYVYKFLQEFKNDPHFAFSFLTRLTHDDIRRTASADEPYYEFVSNMYATGKFSNTVLLLFSDHGIRFGSVRESYIGKLEERLPLMLIAFPPWFYSKYPNLNRNLRINARRLTTFFDVYETLVDILKFPDFSAWSASQQGISLFKEIPAVRNCLSAGIDPHWCTCHLQSRVDVENSYVTSAGREIIAQINNKLADAAQLCARLTLVKVTDAISMSANKEVLKYRRNYLDKYGHSLVDDKTFKASVVSNIYLVTVEASPGGGRFEATVRHDDLTDTYILLGDISRVNRYGDQSSCVEEHWLKKYCYCS